MNKSGEYFIAILFAVWYNIVMIKLVAINTSYVQTMLAPYYLKANSKELKNEIEIITTSTKVELKEIVNMIDVNNAKIVGFSCYIFNINIVRSIARELRRIKHDIVIIYGGPEIEDVGDAVYDEADYIIIGEGEDSYYKLCRDIIDNSIINDRIVHSIPPTLSEVISPYDEYITVVGGKIAYFESSRGCPFSCAYCMSGRARLRNFPMEYVYRELDKFKGSHVKVLKFVDRTFNADNNRALQIMQYIIDYADDFTFAVHFEIAADIISEEFMRLVESAPIGLFQFEIGVQSFNEDTLSAVIRKCDIVKIKKNIARLVGCGKCHIHTDLIAGLPHDDMNSFIDSFNELYALGGEMLQVGILKLLHGSRLESMIRDDKRYVFNNAAPYEVISTPYMSVDELNRIKLLDKAVDKYHNSGMFKLTIPRFLTVSPYEFYSNLIINSTINDINCDAFDIMYDYLIIRGNDRDIVQSYLVADYMVRNKSLPKSGRLINEYDKEFKILLKKYDYNRQSAYEFKLNYDPYTDIRREIIIVAQYQFSDKFCYTIIPII